MKITNEGVNNMWRTHVQARYNKLERARPYAMTPDAKRFLCWLWVASERLAPDNPAELFQSSLEQFADQCGVNVLQPAVPAEVKPPEMWKDLWGNPLPNPWTNKDLKGQTLLMQRAPMLAEWYRKFAESPYAAATEWADKQAAILKKQAVNYDGDAHAINVFANGANETDKAAFIKNAPAEVVQRCQWEAREITFPGAGKDFNLTAQGKITNIPRLSAIWDSMVEQEREYVASEKTALRQQREQAEQRLKALEAADAAPQPERLRGRARIGVE